MAIKHLPCYDIDRRTAASTSKSSVIDKSCHEKDMLVVVVTTQNNAPKSRSFQTFLLSEPRPPQGIGEHITGELAKTVMDFAGRQNKTVQAFESMQKFADVLVDSGKRSKLGKAKFKVVMVIFL